jgi:hypothetical protein
MSDTDAEQRRLPLSGEWPSPTVRPGTAAAIDLILAGARLLFENGQTTERMVAASERLGEALGIQATLFPHWGQPVLRIGDNAASHYEIAAAKRVGMDMNKVTETMAAIDKVCDRRIDAAAMRSVLEATSRLPPVSLARFVFAAAAGAAALGVIFGATHPLSLLLIAFSSVPFCGSVAVCPCMAFSEWHDRSSPGANHARNKSHCLRYPDCYHDQRRTAPGTRIGRRESSGIRSFPRVGVIMTPFADRMRLLFAGLAFASVVSLMPGVFLFRLACRNGRSGYARLKGTSGALQPGGRQWDNGHPDHLSDVVRVGLSKNAYPQSHSVIVSAMEVAMSARFRNGTAGHR